MHNSPPSSSGGRAAGAGAAGGEQAAKKGKRAAVADATTAVGVGGGGEGGYKKRKTGGRAAGAGAAGGEQGAKKGKRAAVADAAVAVGVGGGGEGGYKKRKNPWVETTDLFATPLELRLRHPICNLLKNSMKFLPTVLIDHFIIKAYEHFILLFDLRNSLPLLISTLPSSSTNKRSAQTQRRICKRHAHKSIAATQIT